MATLENQSYDLLLQRLIFRKLGGESARSAIYLTAPRHLLRIASRGRIAA